MKMFYMLSFFYFQIYGSVDYYCLFFTLHVLPSSLLIYQILSQTTIQSIPYVLVSFGGFYLNLGKFLYYPFQKNLTNTVKNRIIPLMSWIL